MNTSENSLHSRLAWASDVSDIVVLEKGRLLKPDAPAGRQGKLSSQQASQC
jgi:hypothetical protein